MVGQIIQVIIAATKVTKKEIETTNVNPWNTSNISGSFIAIISIMYPRNNTRNNNST